ncbi:TetR/AcrR family transcriptional regulator [Amycolatopsis palatopharyngis]|uniref:TetR/AcrR family transcriptional regulator n=1 Tax=Amycolatopsis palatopharyngis TaxID=187982 RepID=UPI001FE93E2F|nr:TetR/AcrR family transcriptional regulator [Amycolatopsis palatopharyngis]
MTGTATRDKMIITALRLFRTEGYPATSWRRLVEEAGTPWGSAYHHFPGGKEELGVAAVELGSAVVRRTVRRAFEREESPAEAVRWWFGKAGQVLVRDEFRSGCPLATITLEMTGRSAELTAACERAFADWHALLASLLGESGYADDVAAELALSIMNSIEGALLLSRVRRSTQPLELAAEHVRLLLDAYGKAN